MKLEHSLKKAITVLSVRAAEYDARREEAMRAYEDAMNAHEDSKSECAVTPSEFVRLARNVKHMEEEMESNREAARTLNAMLVVVTRN